MRRSALQRGDLGRDVLAGVSRSFYLSLAILPGPLRAPLSLGYLLARATDTAADAPGIPAAAREEIIVTMLRLVRQGADPAAFQRISAQLGERAGTPAERLLLRRFGECIAWLGAMDEWDRGDILWTLERITSGQILDVRRFGSASADAPVALGSGDVLREYTYLVAGCVGEFWTRLCFRHHRRFCRLTREEMGEWGVRFGQGLQLVNILRDAPADLRRGRCYIPLRPETLTGDLAADIRRAMEPWIVEAASCIEAAWRYTRSVLPPRIRYACALPALLAARTLDLVRRAGWTELETRVKVSRRDVRLLMIRAVWALRSPGALDRLFARCGCGAPPRP